MRGEKQVIPQQAPDGAHTRNQASEVTLRALKFSNKAPLWNKEETVKVFRLGESQHCGKFWSLKPAFHSGNSPLCAGKVVLSDYSQKHCKIKTNQLEISCPNQSVNLSQWFYNLKKHQNYLKGSLKTQNGGGEVSLHQAIWFNICGMEPIPNKLPGCADAAGLGDLVLRTPNLFY